MALTAAKPLRTAPGPRGVPFFGNVLRAWKDPLGLIEDAARDHGDFVRLRFGPYDYVLLGSPRDIHHVLVENARSYVKSRGYDGVKLVLGQGLLTSEGEHWRKQRKLMQPAFHRERLRHFGEVMATLTDETLAAWRASDSAFDLHSEMMKLTFRIAGQTLFGCELADEADEFGAALSVALKFADQYAQKVVPLPLWVPTASNRHFRQAMAVLDRVVYRIIGERRASGRHGEDLLGMLLDAGMNDQELREEVMTLLLAGHETTANALTWAIVLLARNPTEAERLDDDEAVERVVQEAMRLYPPAWIFERMATEDDVVGGFALEKGTTALIAPWLLHRSPKHWDAPERFDPDRWRPERSAGRDPGVYLPFGDGPRVCIGRAFAMMEAKIILGRLTRACRFEVLSTSPIEIDPGITLRPRGWVPARVTWR